MAAAILMLVTLAAPVAAAQDAEQDLDRAEAESRLGQVLEEIDQLKTALESSRTEQRREQDRLRNLDLRIQQANSDLRKLQEQKAAQQQELETLLRQRSEYLGQLEQRMDQLAEQLRRSYRNSRQSRIQLVLNQDDLGRLGRLLAYYDYYARAQADRIALLRSALTLSLIHI